MSRIAVVTSSPPMVEGGHMVIARSLVQALREAGHDAEVVVTPQNRFGRQASAYLATWLTDVGSSGGRADRPGDQPAVSELRRTPPASRLLAESHDARVLRSVGPRFSRPAEPAGARQGERPPPPDPRRRSLSADAERHPALRAVAHDAEPAGDVAGAAVDGALSAARRSAPYRCDEYGDYIFMVSRLTPLKRADLLVRALAAPAAAGMRAVIAGDGEEHARLVALVAALGVSGPRDVHRRPDRRASSSTIWRDAAPSAFRRSRRTTGS